MTFKKHSKFRSLVAVCLMAVAISAFAVNPWTPGTRTVSITTAATLTGATRIDTLDVGASGSAGSLDLFPATAAKGKVAFTAPDNAGNTTTAVTFAAQAAARTYTVPDAGASASFLMTEGAATVNGLKTLTAGLAPAGGFASSPRVFHTGGSAPMAAADGTDYTVVATEVLIAEVFVPANVTLTGVAIFNGSAVAGNIKVGLANSSGAVVATSASTAQAGTDAYQRVPFTGTYAAVGPATYYVLAIGDTGGGTSLINTHTIGNFGAAKQTGQVYATGFTTITPPTTFSTGLGPLASLY